MNTLKSDNSNSTITVDYDDTTNLVEIHIGNKEGFRFVNLNERKAEYLIEILTEFKNMIIL